MLRSILTLNALHLKTGLDNEDGYNAKPFNKIPQSSGTEHDPNTFEDHDHRNRSYSKRYEKRKMTIYQLRKLKTINTRMRLILLSRNILRFIKT